MHTPFYTTVLLALVGGTSVLSAQTRSPRPMRERDDAPSRVHTIISRLSDDPERPRLGLSVEPTGARDTLGVLVAEVTEGGPAAKAGVKAGDRLIAINGVNLRLDPADAEDEAMQGVTSRRLTRELGRHKVGDAVELRLMREGRPLTLTVPTVAASEVSPYRATWTATARSDANRASLGIGLGISGSARDSLGILIVRVTSDGPGEKAGLEEGDRLVAINGVELRVPREDVGDWAASSARVRRLSRELEKVKAGDDVELRVYRAGQTRTVKVRSVPARELEGDRGATFMIGEGPSLDGLSFDMPPRMPPRMPALPFAPPSPDEPAPPTPPSPPMPPLPRLYFFDGDDSGAMRLRISPRQQFEVRERTRDALERAMELVPRARTRLRVDMNDL